jgi:hypothetical protein
VANFLGTSLSGASNHTLAPALAHRSPSGLAQLLHWLVVLA